MSFDHWTTNSSGLDDDERATKRSQDIKTAAKNKIAQVEKEAEEAVMATFRIKVYQNNNTLSIFDNELKIQYPTYEQLLNRIQNLGDPPLYIIITIPDSINRPGRCYSFGRNTFDLVKAWPEVCINVYEDRWVGGVHPIRRKMPDIDESQFVVVLHNAQAEAEEEAGEEEVAEGEQEAEEEAAEEEVAEGEQEADAHVDAEA